MWRESFAVASPLDDDLVAGVGEPIESAVADDRVTEGFTMPLSLIALLVRRGPAATLSARE